MPLWSRRDICSRFQSILLDVVVADTSLDPASGDMLMKLYVFACMSVASSERSSAPLCPGERPSKILVSGLSDSDGSLLRSLGEAGWVWLQKIMADQEHFQGGLLQIGISFASSAQVWLSWILPDVSCSLNTALLRSLNSQRSLTASFGADVINLFNILPNRDTIAKQRHFISLFPSPGDNLLSVFMTKLDRYNRVARLIWFAWLDLLSKNGWQTCVHVHDRVCVFKHSF